MTLKQRRLNAALGEPWQVDYMRRRRDGWSQKEIAAFYRISIGKVGESCLSKWARRLGLEERKERAA